MTDSINRLSQTVRQSANDASSDLRDIADKQEDLVNQQKELRDVQSKLETSKSGGDPAAKPISQGISSAKDSFETKASNPLFEANPATGNIRFGDGLQGKVPGSNVDIQSHWKSELGSAGNADGGAVDPNALVQHVLRASYLQTTEDLKFYAEKVKHFNDMKKQLREELQGLMDEPSLQSVDRLMVGKDPDALGQLASAVKDSVQDSNESKKYYLDLLQKMNKISTEISGQLEAISDASKRLAKKEKDDDD